MNVPPAMVPGRVYRTRELRAFTASPSRWAKRLVAQGVLRRAHHGLFYLPRTSRFGPVPASEQELLRAFLGSEEFLFTGPYVWNALRLGTTQLFSVTLVYNWERTGEVALDGRRFWFRRVRFPRSPSAEWFVVDLLQNESRLGEDTSTLDERLVHALRSGRFDRERLAEAAAEYARPVVRERLMRAIAASASAAVPVVLDTFREE